MSNTRVALENLNDDLTSGRITWTEYDSRRVSLFGQERDNFGEIEAAYAAEGSDTPSF